MRARERLADVLFHSGALSVVHRLRRLASVFQQVVILTYHRIADHSPGYPYDSDIADATPEQFRRQMELLARHRTPFGIDQLARRLAVAEQSGDGDVR